MHLSPNPHGPLILPALTLLAGLLLGRAVSPSACSVLAGGGLLGFIASQGRRGLPLALSLGLLCAAATTPPPAPPGLGALPSRCLVTLQGRVTSAPPPSRFRQRLQLAVISIGTGERRVVTHFAIGLRARRGVIPAEACIPGAELELIAALGPIRHGRAYGEVREVGWVRVLSPAPWHARTVRTIRQRAAATLDARLRPFDAGLARALVAGDRERLSFLDRQRFRSTGQAHLLAVSGLHVALVAGALLALLRTLRLSLGWAHVIALLAVVFYVPFTGASPSAVRAGIGTVIYLLAPLCRRLTTGLGVLAAVTVLIVIFDPAAYSRLGLWLSLSAVTGILVLGPKLTEALTANTIDLPGARQPRTLWIRRGLAISIAAWLGTLSIVAATLGQLCLVAPVLSVVAMPFIAILVGTALLLLALAGTPILGAAIAPVFAHTADALRLLFGTVLELGLGGRAVAPPSPLWHAAYVLGLIGVVRAAPTRRLLWLLGLVVLAVILPGADGSSTNAAPQYDHLDAASLEALRIEDPMSPTPLLMVSIGLLAFAAASVRPLGWLTRGGAAGAYVLGVAAAWRFGWPGFTALMLTFLVTTALSKLPGRNRSGARTLRQVVSNGGVPLLGAVLSALGYDWGAAVFLGGLAFLGADTVSSEIGSRYGGPARRVLSFTRVPAGTSGGISPIGSVAGALGACIAPLAWVLVSGHGMLGVMWLALAGLLGGVVDSVLGDTLQYRGTHPETGEVTERRTIGGTPTAHVSGMRWLDNDMVNLLGGVAAAALALVLLP